MRNIKAIFSICTLVFLIACRGKHLEIPSDFEKAEQTKFIEAKNDSIGPDGLTISKHLKKDTLFLDSVVMKLNMRVGDKLTYQFTDSTGFWDGESHMPKIFSAELVYTITDASMDKYLMMGTFSKITFKLDPESPTPLYSFDSQNFIPGTKYDRLQSLIGRSFYVTINSSGQVMAADGLLEIVTLMGPEFTEVSLALIPDFPYTPYRFLTINEIWKTKAVENKTDIYSNYRVTKAYNETVFIEKTIQNTAINHTTNYKIDLRNGLFQTIDSDRRRNFYLDVQGKKKSGMEVYIRHSNLTFATQ
jgi:hypothetical protein